MTFAEYVAFYGLTRSEGLVLRYLGDAYRALRQTVPDSVRTDELEDIIEWLGAVVRQTDSSLLDEWEQLNDPDRLAGRRAGRAATRPGADHRQRTRIHRAGAQRDVPTGGAGGAEALGAARRARGRDRVEYRCRGLARGAGGVLRRARHASTPARTRAGRRCCWWRRASRTWEVQQILGDPEGDHDWRITATVDLAASDDEGELVLDVTGLVQL